MVLKLAPRNKLMRNLQLHLWKWRQAGVLYSTAATQSHLSIGYQTTLATQYTRSFVKSYQESGEKEKACPTESCKPRSNIVNGMKRASRYREPPRSLMIGSIPPPPANQSNLLPRYQISPLSNIPTALPSSLTTLMKALTTTATA